MTNDPLNPDEHPGLFETEEIEVGFPCVSPWFALMIGLAATVFVGWVMLR